jgi:DnaA regulatory inactivator Hda
MLVFMGFQTMEAVYKHPMKFVQPPLSLPFRPAMDASDFIVTPTNQAAVAVLESWPDWPARILVLQGEAGAGKTHLAQVWAQQSGAMRVQAKGLDHQQLYDKTQLIIEDIETVFGDVMAEQQLFHLYNHFQQHGFLLLTCCTPPAQATITLPDLSSRLRACPLLTLAPPDDGLLAALLVKHFHDRQLTVSDEVISYLLPRVPRSPAALGALVTQLDQTALARQQPITIPLARAVLQSSD